MYYPSILLSLALTTLASASTLSSPHYPRANSSTSSTSSACVPAGAIHMIVARASTEAPGEGIIGSVATMVKASLPGSDSEAVEYPATLTQYQASEASGVAAMQKLVQAYAEKCPGSKMAVMGYSQGAQVAAMSCVGLLKRGSLGILRPCRRTSVVMVIVAMVLMGDPSHVPAETFNAGTAKNNGLFARQNIAACPTEKTVSYCDNQDEFCDSGNSLQVHLSYVTTYGTAAAKFITDKMAGETSSSASTNGTANAITASAAKSAQSLARAATMSTNGVAKMGASWGMLATFLGLGVLI
ncbi:acetyl xylanesterase [Botrytis cinerea]